MSARHACPYCGAAEVRRPDGRPIFPRHCSAGHKWWQANPGPQYRFVESECEEILYGGAAGGGKSSALVNIPLRWHHIPQFRGLILRRETTDLDQLIDEARTWYPLTDPAVRFVGRGAGLVAKFGSGAEQHFNHCQHATDAGKYQGKEFQYIGLDELTHFLRSQYLELKSRIRSPIDGLPRYIRATSNPGGEGHEWVAERWGAWIQPDFEAPGLSPRYVDGRRVPPIPPNVFAWITRLGEQEVYISAAEAARRLAYAVARPDDVDAQAQRPLRRTFIPALIKDNPALLYGDPGYVANLNALDRVRRAQLLGGDWLIRLAKGDLFKRAWYKVCNRADVPHRAVLVRAWDRAATEKKKGNEPDWTVGLLVAKCDDKYYVLDMVRLRGAPPEVAKTIKATAEADGKNVHIAISQDPGQAGEVEAAVYRKLLAGWPVHFIRETGDKAIRAAAVSPQVEHGNFWIARGSWDIKEFFAELEEFPEGAHDDIVDAQSLAFSFLAPREVTSEDEDDWDALLPQGRI